MEASFTWVKPSKDAKLIAIDKQNERCLFLKEEDATQLSKDEQLRRQLMKNIMQLGQMTFGTGATKQVKIQGTFEPIPSTIGKREIIYISAPSGAGKSYWVSQYCNNYKLLYPKNNIIVFSRLQDDSSLDRISNLIRIPITNDLITDPIDIQEDFKNCCVIFDDCDTIGDKNHRRAVMQIMDDILQTGRHSNTTCLITSHLSTNYKETRIVLAEAHKFVLFPKSSTKSSMDRILDAYLGLDKDERRAVYKMPSRWVCIHKHHPRYLLGQKEATIL